MKVSVIGQGYVGLPIALHAAHAGFNVVGMDLNLSLVESLNQGISHIEDIRDSFLNQAISSGNYIASSNFSSISDSDIAIIAVPTPLGDDRKPDLSFIQDASRMLGENLKKPTLIINESTSHPGTLRNLIMHTVQEYSTKGISHLFAISPERVDPGNAQWNIKTTPRLVAGITNEALKRTKEFYSNFCDTLIDVSSPEVAELAKLFENTFRQVNIALVNELALITRSMGISVNEVIDAAATKPYGFMKFKPGIGVGGHCIPVDPTYLASAAEVHGIEARFVNLANKVNLEIPQKLVERIIFENGGTVSGKSILICGMAYKPNVGDTRESPSILLRDILIEKGAKVSWYDPLVKSIDGEFSIDLNNIIFDIIIVAVVHREMNLQQIITSSKYIFDCTGILKMGHQL